MVTASTLQPVSQIRPRSERNAAWSAMLPLSTVEPGCLRMTTSPNRVAIAAVNVCGRRPVTRTSNRDVMRSRSPLDPPPRATLGCNHPGGVLGRTLMCLLLPTRVRVRDHGVRTTTVDLPGARGPRDQHVDAASARPIGPGTDRCQGAGSAVASGAGRPRTSGEPAPGGRIGPVDGRGVAGGMGKD